MMLQDIIYVMVLVRADGLSLIFFPSSKEKYLSSCSAETNLLETWDGEEEVSICWLLGEIWPVLEEIYGKTRKKT